MAISKGEQRIIEILSKEKIPFEREKTFGEGKVSMCRFDFYIKDLNCCLEFQGIQHMIHNSFFHKSRSEFLKAQERDRAKISYCLGNGIKLYCIPYWELDNLTTSADLFQDKFLARNKFHNDEVWREYKRKQKNTPKP